MSKGKADGKPCARQVCRATGQTIAAAPLAAEDGGYQNWQRRTAAIRTVNEAWRD